MNVSSKHYRIQDYLGHIEEAATLACRYIQGLTKEGFIEDKRTQQAVIYNILIIGEAATKIINEYPDFVAEHDHIPWREMRGIRNRMAHGYNELSLDIIWDTVTTNLERLRLQIISVKTGLV